MHQKAPPVRAIKDHVFAHAARYARPIPNETLAEEAYDALRCDHKHINDQFLAKFTPILQRFCLATHNREPYVAMAGFDDRRFGLRLTGLTRALRVAINVLQEERDAVAIAAGRDLSEATPVTMLDIRQIEPGVIRGLGDVGLGSLIVVFGDPESPNEAGGIANNS